MAKILIVDIDGDGLSFAWRCIMAGHEVRWFVKPNKAVDPNIGRGFKGIERVENWVAHVKWADLIVPTGNADYIERLDSFSKKGLPVFGPSVKSANLEISREDGMKIMEKAGFNIAPYKVFTDMHEAEDHVRKTNERFVFKTMGDNEDKSLTYCSKSAADMVGWMKRKRESGIQPHGKVMLQAFVDGVELGVSRWMGLNGWVGQPNESFEGKKFMSGGYGPNTGEMHTVASFVPEKDSKIFNDTLKKLESDLTALRHMGDTAIGFMIEKETGTPYPTEFTMRWGWPIFNMMLGATEGDPAQWMIDALQGKDSTTFKEDIGCILVAAHGDFPHTETLKKEHIGVPVYGITKGSKRHLHPHDVKIDVMPDMEKDLIVERPLWNTAGDHVVDITGYGSTIKQATERAYKTAKQLSLSNMMLRDDCGECLKDDLKILNKFGYATHFKYE
jgi:phosphoribosylamine---glycine ligase